MSRTYRPSNNGDQQNGQRRGPLSTTAVIPSATLPALREPNAGRPAGWTPFDPYGRPKIDGALGFGRGTANPAAEAALARIASQAPQTSAAPMASTFIRDPYGRPTSGVGFGRGDGSSGGPNGRPVANAGTYSMSNPGFTGPIDDPLGRDPNGGGFGQGLTDSQIAWENQSAFDREWAAAMAELGLNPDGTPINGGGGGAGGGGGGGFVNNFDYGSAIQGLMQSGIFDPVAVPELQQYANPIMQAAQQLPEFQQWNPEMIDPASLQNWNPTLINSADIQQWNPELIDVASLQQWNPEMLAAPDFSGQYDNIAALYDQTTGQIADAFAPAIQALSAPLQTSIGAVAGTAQGLTPELQALADAQGVGSDYASQLAAENQGIQSNADLFSGRNQMLDRVFGNNRLNNLNIANQSQAGALSNASVQRMLATAGLDQIAQNAAIQNAQYNNALQNQAGQYNSGLVNNALLSNNALQNQAGQFNAGVANEALFANNGLQNQAGQFNAGVTNNALLSNNALQNQAGQFNASGANDWALQQAGLNSAVDATNTNVLNNWLMANTDIANQQSTLGYDAAAGAQANRLQAVLDLIAQAAANGVAFDPSVLQGMVA